MRIVHVFRAPVGGLFRHVLDLARGQVARGHQVGLFCDSLTGGPYTDAVLAELGPRLALGLVRVPMHRNPSPTDLSALLSFRGYLEGRDIEVVHGHGSKGGMLARVSRFTGAAPGAVRAYTPHGGSFNYQPGTLIHRVYMKAESVFERSTDLFLFESGYIRDRFRAEVGDTRKIVRVVHNGISDAEFAPIDGSSAEFDLVYIGELRSAKGIDTLLSAIARLKESGRIVTALIVGSGPDEALLSSMAAGLGVSEQVRFHGPSPIRKALAQGRIMVVPSRAESLPYVVLEAVAGAQPLVATNVGGIPEIFGPYGDRLIRPDDDAIMAQAIAEKLDQSPEKRSDEARELQVFAHGRFSLDGMIDGVLAGYSAAHAGKIGAAATATT